MGPAEYRPRVRTVIRVHRQLCLLAALSLVLFLGAAVAHTDLELQIEALNRQIELEGPQAELLLKRGNLYRRHEDWDRAVRDFADVRQLDPAHPQVDWIEGLYLFDTAQWQKANTMISRFIESNRGFAAAYHVRGEARWKTGDRKGAASDYQSAIDLSERPSPALFRSHIIAELAAGPDGLAAAEQSAKNGLNHFPQELSLLGLAVDLALVRSESQEALHTMMRVPARLQSLLQWRFRRAVWFCIRGETEQARSELQSMLEPRDEVERRKAGTFDLTPDDIRNLEAGLNADRCRAAVLERLSILEP